MLKAVKTDRWPTKFLESGLVTPIGDYKLVEECFITEAGDVSALIGQAFEAYPDYDEMTLKIDPEGNGWRVRVLPVARVDRVTVVDRLYTPAEFQQILLELQSTNWTTFMIAYRSGRIKSVSGQKLLPEKE
jgi:hypothetical protein